MVSDAGVASSLVSSGGLRGAAIAAALATASGTADERPCREGGGRLRLAELEAGASGPVRLSASSFDRYPFLGDLAPVFFFFRPFRLPSLYRQGVSAVCDDA